MFRQNMQYHQGLRATSSVPKDQALVLDCAGTRGGRVKVSASNLLLVILCDAMLFVDVKVASVSNMAMFLPVAT